VQAKGLCNTHYLRQDYLDAFDQLRGLWDTSCQACGRDLRGLDWLQHLDHINGGGTLERRERFQNSHDHFVCYYGKHLDEAKEKLQLLCSECHDFKTYCERHDMPFRGTPEEYLASRN
jgi:hypothetical protein